MRIHSHREPVCSEPFENSRSNSHLRAMTLIFVLIIVMLNVGCSPSRKTPGMESTEYRAVTRPPVETSPALPAVLIALAPNGANSINLDTHQCEVLPFEDLLWIRSVADRCIRRKHGSTNAAPGIITTRPARRLNKEGGSCRYRNRAELGVSSREGWLIYGWDSGRRLEALGRSGGSLRRKSI